MRHSRFNSLSRDKLRTIVLTAAYLSLFLFNYLKWGTNYAYMGLSFHPESVGMLLTTITVILVYVASNNTKIPSFSRFFVEAQFFIIVVPSLLVVSIQSKPTVERLAAIAGLFCAHLLLKFIAAIKVKPISGLTRGSGSNVVFYFLIFLVALSALYLIASYFPYMRLVGLSEVHAHRIFTRNVVSVPLSGHILGFLQNAIMPLLIALGVFSRSRLYVLVGFALGIIIYSIVSAKIALAQALLTFLIALVVRHFNRVDINFVISGLIVLLALVAAIIVTSSFAPSGMALEIAALIFMRSFALQGALTGVYLEYFATNPVTYYSHVGIIGKLTDYPYESPLGFVIGDYLGGAGTFNANANFWATDGIAALGVAGLFVIALIVGIFLLFTKLFLTKELTLIAAVASIPFIMSLGNSSFFTNLLTGGGLVLFILLRLVTKPENDNSVYRCSR